MGVVIAIYLCPEKGLPMKSVMASRAITGVGLEGDRYALGLGAFSQSKRVTIRHVSFISIEAIDRANKEMSEAFAAIETRRNILTRGVDLNALVGHEFSVGLVKMKGVELCEPCTRPSILAKKDGFDWAFRNRGGLRAEILTEGLIEVGDEIVVPA